MAQTHFLALPNKDLISSFTFNYYGTRLAVSSLDHHIYILTSDPETGKWPEDQTQEQEPQPALSNNNNNSNAEPPSSRKSGPPALQAWTAHEGPVIKVIWSDPIHGEILASAGTDGTVRIWEEDARRMDYSTGGTAQQEKGKGGTLWAGGWYQRTMLADSNRGIRDIGFSPMETSLRLASISSDGHLRVYECLESGSFSSENWALIINIHLARLPPHPSSHTDHLNPALPPNSAPSPAAAAAAAAAASATQPSSQQSPFTSVRGFDPSLSLNTLKGNNKTSTITGGGSSNFNLINPLSGIRSSTTSNSNNNNNNNTASCSTEHQEAFGGWALSWCPESYWGEMLAVSAGTQGYIRLIELKPHSQWDNFAVLDPVSVTSTVVDSPSHRHAATSPKQTATTISSGSGVGGGGGGGGGGTTATTATTGPTGMAVSCLAWAPACGRDYHLIAAGHRDGRARIWKGRTGPDPAFHLDTELDHHLGPAADSRPPGGVAKCHWNLTGSVLSTSAADGKIRIWKMGYTSRWVNTAEISCIHDPRGSDEDNHLRHQPRPSPSSAVVAAAASTTTPTGANTHPNPLLHSNGNPADDDGDGTIIIG